MIRIVTSSDNKGLYICIKPGYPLEHSIDDAQKELNFYRTGASAIETQLLAAHLRDVLMTTIKGIREEAYLQGWRHAKAKTRKETWFSGALP